MIELDRDYLAGTVLTGCGAALILIGWISGTNAGFVGGFVLGFAIGAVGLAELAGVYRLRRLRRESLAPLDGRGLDLVRRRSQAHQTHAEREWPR